MFGKDIRAVLAMCCQKIFFEAGHTYYHYGPLEREGFYNRQGGITHGYRCAYIAALDVPEKLVQSPRNIERGGIAGTCLVVKETGA